MTPAEFSVYWDQISNILIAKIYDFAAIRMFQFGCQQFSNRIAFFFITKLFKFSNSIIPTQSWPDSWVYHYVPNFRVYRQQTFRFRNTKTFSMLSEEFIEFTAEILQIYHRKNFKFLQNQIFHYIASRSLVLHSTGFRYFRFIARFSSFRCWF